MSESEFSFEALLRRIVREEVQSVIGQDGHQNDDQLLDAEASAKILCVSTDWLYRNARRLPFTRKLSPKLLRFSCQGIQKWLATRKLPNTTPGT